MGVVSLFDGSTTGVPMSSWYGGYQIATPPPSKKQLTHRPVAAQRSTSTTPLKHRSFLPQLTLPRATTLTSWRITLPRVTTRPRRRSMTMHAAPSYYIEAPKYTVFWATYCTDFPKYYSVPSFYTEAPADYSTESSADYSTEAPANYSTEAPANYSTEAPADYSTEASKYYSAPTYYTETALSCYVEQKYYTDAPVHYTTTYAKPQPPGTTPKKPPITQQRMLPLPTTPRPRITTTLNPSITTLQLRYPELLHRRPEVLLCVKGVV
jgi:hypothetical protein